MITPQILAMYLGCRMRINKYGKDYFGTLEGLTNNELWIRIDGDRVATPERYFAKCTLILRPLSSMTEEEAKELFIIRDSHRFKVDWIKIELTKENPTKFETDYKFERGWRISAKYKDLKGKEQGMAGTLSLTSFQSEQFQWLLYKHFDLFNLIEQDLAIDSSKL